MSIGRLAPCRITSTPQGHKGCRCACAHTGMSPMGHDHMRPVPPAWHEACVINTTRDMCHRHIQQAHTTGMYRRHAPQALNTGMYRRHAPQAHNTGMHHRHVPQEWHEYMRHEASRTGCFLSLFSERIQGRILGWILGQILGRILVLSP